MLHQLYLPRPEYPRPDRQRGFIHGVDWVNLNGPWQFRFDGDRRGVEERWFDPGLPEWREQIIVPFCWESLAAWGEADAAGNENYYAKRVFKDPLNVTKANHRTAQRYEVGWYRRQIEVPENEFWRGKNAVLTIGASDFFTDCWCNGVHLGHHEGGYTPFEFNLTPALQRTQTGKLIANIVIRVEDPMNNSEQPVGKQWKWYTPTSGIWQTVFIEPRSPSFIDHFRILTDIDSHKADFSIFCENVEKGEVLLRITSPDGKNHETRCEVENHYSECSIPTEPLFLWDPNDPKLYQVEMLLMRDNQVLDKVHTYFGMRKIGSISADEPDAPGALSFNNQPIYLRGALYQSFYPDGVYTAGESQMLRNDITFAKEAGFDFLRIHIKIDDPLLLYYADTMGILLMADFPNFGEGGDTPLGRQRFEEMMRKGIDRDFNHPSIIAWCLFNETWGFGGQNEFVKLFNPETREEIQPLPANLPLQKLANQSSQIWVQQMWELAKSLDSSRLIEDMSVVAWEHLHYYAHGDTDINSWHFYNNDYSSAKSHIEKVVEQTYTGSTFNYVEGFKQGSQPLITSEYGGVGALDGDRDVSWSFKWLTNELRRHTKLSAYIYTELHDVEWEYNGLLNYDRTIKEFGYDPKIINNGDVLPVDCPPISKKQLSELVEVEVCSSHYSRRRKTDVSLSWSLHGIDGLGKVHQDIARGYLPIPFTHGKVEKVHKVRFTMPGTTMLCTLSLNALGRDGSVVASNFVQFFSSPGTYPQREEIPNGLIFRCDVADWTIAEWTNKMSGKEDAKKNDACFGQSIGFFEWQLPLGEINFANAKRLRVLCEASSKRFDNPQTDYHAYPSQLQILLNHVRVYDSMLPNHPHDARGCLSYLRGGLGAYGYLAHSIVEGKLLAEVAESTRDNVLRFRCEVPANAIAPGGLTIYGAECGRYPLGPTVVIEW